MARQKGHISIIGRREKDKNEKSENTKNKTWLQQSARLRCKTVLIVKKMK
jgi:hypothetical protein